MGYPDSIRFGYGKTLAGVLTKTKSWDEICKVFTKPHRVYKDKADATNAPNILGGPTDDRGKDMENILSRSMITLDYDDLPGHVTVETLTADLDLTGYAAIAYTTFSHMTERAEGRARIRVIVPLSEEIQVKDYPAAARALADLIGHNAAKESFSAACVMFLPSCAEGYEQHAWSRVFEGEPFPAHLIQTQPDNTEHDDDLFLETVYSPLDITEIEIDKALELHPSEGLDYDEWLQVGLALWHQYEGDEAGFDRWLAWSEKSSKHDPKTMRRKWKSGGGRDNPITMASVFAKVGGLNHIRTLLEGEGVDLSEVKTPSKITEKVAALCERASNIKTLEDYDALKQTLLRIPETKLGSDYRGMIADDIYIAWGKTNGLTKSDIKKYLTPEKRRYVPATGNENADDRRALSEADCWDENKPEWLRGWVYDETGNEFVQIETGHSIKREAFNMRFTREDDCAAHEVDAVTLASRVFPIPTVASKMYWPGQGRIFQGNGKTYLNSWQEGGGSSVQAAEPGSFEIGDDSIEGQACEVFLDHLNRTITNERERKLVMDWLAFVYSKPGARVKWALLLWGIEGNGKSYFHNVLTRLMGADAREIGASLIEERFTDWAEGCRVIGVEEIRVSGTNKWRTLDKMKPFISNDQIQVEGKGDKAKVVPNFASYILFTNHADAIPIHGGDRRYFVVFTKHRTRDDLYDEHGGPQGVNDYFKRLFDVSMAGASGIARMLLDHEYSDEFDPHGRAPDSIGKEEMRLMHIDDGDDALADALEKFHGPYINEKIIDVTLLKEECDMDAHIELPKTSAMSHKLVAMGYSKLGRIKARKMMRTAWYQPNKISKDDAEAAMRQGGVDDFVPDVPF